MTVTAHVLSDPVADSPGLVADPTAAPAWRRVGVGVATIDYPRAARLACLLPTGWSVLSGGQIEQRRPDLVVLGRPDPGVVSATRARWPEALLLAVLAEPGDASEVISLLHAGAHGCTRGDSPALVSAHLGALLRWRLLGRQR